MYRFKQIDGHTITKFIYEVRTLEGRLVYINSPRLIVDKSKFLDYYAKWYSIDREGLTLIYKQISVELEFEDV